MEGSECPLLWRARRWNRMSAFPLELPYMYLLRMANIFVLVCLYCQPGDVLSVWSIDNHPEWACRWHFASVGGEDLARFEPDQLPFHLSPIHQAKQQHQKCKNAKIMQKCCFVNLSLSSIFGNAGRLHADLCFFFFLFCVGCLQLIQQGHVIHDVVIGVDDANDSTSLVLTQKDRCAIVPCCTGMHFSLIVQVVWCRGHNC